MTQVLVLHFGASLAHLALVFGEQHLVDNDVVHVDLELRELLDKPFSFIHGQKFWNADCNERGEFLHRKWRYWILHLFIDGC